MNYRVRFSNVTKKYKMYNKPLDKLKDLFFKTSNGEYHYALNNVSFEVTEGEIVVIIRFKRFNKLCAYPSNFTI